MSSAAKLLPDVERQRLQALAHTDCYRLPSGGHAELPGRGQCDYFL